VLPWHGRCSSFPDFAPFYGLSTQFLLGKSVMVSPVLEKGATSVCAMFPPGTWYNLFDTTKVVVSTGPAR
jgi:alpha-D-xyloside xylohydrolase